jgi:hypothetical protein
MEEQEYPDGRKPIGKIERKPSHFYWTDKDGVVWERPMGKKKQ